MREIILEYFDKLYEIVNDMIVSYMLGEDNLRCLIDNKWEKCSEENIKLIDRHKEGMKQKQIHENPYKLLGQITSLEPYKFCIRDLRNPKEKRSQIQSGKVCENWNKKELYDIAINILQIPLPPKDVVDKYISRLAKKHKLETYFKPNITEDGLKQVISKLPTIKDMTFKNFSTIEDLLKIIYYGTLKKPELCPYIQEFFKSKNLLQIDDGCGSQTKTKPIDD